MMSTTRNSSESGKWRRFAMNIASARRLMPRRSASASLPPTISDAVCSIFTLVALTDSFSSTLPNTAITPNDDGWISVVRNKGRSAAGRNERRAAISGLSDGES